MNLRTFYFLFVGFFVTIFCSTDVDAQTKTIANKTLAPYFVVLSDEGSLASLPLKSTNVSVNISGIIADVKVSQVYSNTGSATIEAIYVFPASTRAAVYQMEMNVNGRIIKAVVEEKKKARKKYDNAKKEGRTASLLEEETPNVFKMNVANIVPGAKVEVTLCYTELLVPTDKIYEFVFPTVVGPRYISKKESANGEAKPWDANPYLRAGENATSKLNLEVNIAAGMPISNITCGTHQCNIRFRGKTEAVVSMLEPEGGNRDFVMKYRLAGDEIETGLLTYTDKSGEKYFLAMVQPPSTVSDEMVIPREYVFILDVSGSMNGFPLEVGKKLMLDLLNGLKPADKFNIVLFAGASAVFSVESVTASEKNIHDALSFVNKSNGGGGTELLSALKTALAFTETENLSRSYVILTDGYVSVEKEAYDLIRNNLGSANFFAFGIGTSVNRALIEGIAHVGYGEPFVVLNETEAAGIAAKFLKYISQPVLSEIQFNWNNCTAYDVLPEKFPDLFAQRPLIISGKYIGDLAGSIQISGKSGCRIFSKVVDFSNNVKSQSQAVKYFWAREKIRRLSDFNNAGKDSILTREIVALGEKYNLLTEFTSFIAVDSVISNTSGQQNTVNQPLPLPLGVSDLAINDELEIECTELTDEVCEDVQEFFIIEESPKFVGGDTALVNYLKNTVRYPQEAQNKGIQGKVYVKFDIDKDGRVIDVAIARGVHPLLDAEALRVVKAMPRWIPGKQRGVVVRVSYMLPISFVL